MWLFSMKKYIPTFCQKMVFWILRCIGNLPNRIGFICDGNRTYAQKNNVSIESAYRLGVEKLLECTDWCETLGISEITFYLLSRDNLCRTTEGVNRIYNAIRDYIQILIAEEYGTCRYRTIGDLSLIPKDIERLCWRLTVKTENLTYPRMTVNLAIGYSGKEEIIEICSELIKQTRIHEKSLTPVATVNSFNRLLRQKGEHPLSLDVLIRTSVHKRISNFMMWQAAKSYMTFSLVLWPELSVYSFLKILISYKLFKRTHKSVISSLQ